MDVRVDRPLRQVARRLDAAHVPLPERRHPAHGLLAVLGRHALARERLGERLVRADLEDLDRDAEAFERLVEIQPVGREALDRDLAGGVDVRLVGLRHQEVLLLRRVAGVGVDLLAGLAELLQRVGDRAQLGVAAATEALRVEHDQSDAVVVARLVDGLDDVADQRLGFVVAGHQPQRALERAAAELLDQAPLEAQHERRLRRHQRQGVAEREEHGAEQRRQQQQVQHLAQPVQRAPHEGECPTYPTHADSCGNAAGPSRRTSVYRVSGGGAA